jgi:hypothetical protein
MDPTPRLFLCARCRAQVLICPACDRGHRYCSPECARVSRCCSQRAAGQRYQGSRRGRHAHAERARRWRERQRKVTHQGSLAPQPDALLPVDSAPVITGLEDQPLALAAAPILRCHFCGCACSAFVRPGFLRTGRVLRSPYRGSDLGDFP